MKYINKSHRREPQSLRIFRETTPNAGYTGLNGDIKSEIRYVLAEEQGYICAYCMRRIQPNNKDMEIEHYITQKRHENSPYSDQDHQNGQLNYKNMLGTCNGGRSCSSIRANKPLLVNPMSPDCERLIKFKKDGKVYSDDENVKLDIQTLQLDLLSEARKVVIDKARNEAKKRTNWNNEFLDAEIAKWTTLKHTRYGLAFEEFCMAAVSYLESKKRK